jgi:hypothetical protein
MSCLHLAATRSQLAQRQRQRGAVLQTQAMAQPDPEYASASETLGWGADLLHQVLFAAASLNTCIRPDQG